MFSFIDFNKLFNLFKYDQYDPLFFASSFFLFYFLLVLVVYRLFSKSKNLRIYSLIFFSIFFYYKNAGYFFFLLLFLSVFNFYAGSWIHKSAGLKRRIIFVVTLFLNLGLLGYFKYTNFLLSIFNDLKLGSFQPLDILLPVGISFFTFKALSYIIEIYFEMLEPINSLRNFTLFVFFFPNLLSGPIDRASEFLPQIEEDFQFDKKQIGVAVFFLCSGLIKKYVIADYISLNFIDRVFEFPQRFEGILNLFAIYAYALQVFCDFSGYTDMAMGIGLLLGFKLRENFNSPYKANSVMDYWRRWHMSLSTWLLDYLFKPLQIQFRNLKNYGNALAILITFIAVGIWHGANWNFVFFGLLHSFFIIFSIFTIKYRKLFYKKLGLENSKVVKLFQIIFTFHLLIFSGVFFRASSFDYAFKMFGQILNYFHGEIFWQFVTSYQATFFIIIFGYLMHYSPEKLKAKIPELIGKIPVWAQAVLLSIVIWIVTQVRYADLQPFIYFKF